MTGRLEVPPDLVIDPVSVDRLARQLAAAPASVVGIVAPLDDLPPGASTRVHAEWRSLVALDAAHDVESSGAGGPDGAVLLRDAATATTIGVQVRVADGSLRVDPGAVCHRRSISAAPDEDAGDEARSPFPWRPVVLFLALDDQAPDDDRAAWLEPLIDGLLDADVEPRLAAPTAGTAPRRHRPCAPTAATVDQLAPNVVVALDPTALEQAPAWCIRRGTVLIDLTAGDPSSQAIELVSWQIDDGPTRLRARVGRSVAPDVLAKLVNRLAAGPQPAPPTDRPPSGAVGATRVGIGTTGPRPRRIAVVASGSAGPLLDGPLIAGLADRCAAAGHVVDHGAQRAPDADVVLVAAAHLGAMTDALAERTAAGRPTVVVVDDDQIDQQADEIAELAGRGLDLVAVAAEVGTVDRLRAQGVPTQLVPVMSPVARRDALRAAADGPVASSGGVVVWTVLGATGDERPDDAAVAAALATLRDERPDLEVEMVTGRPDPGELARHTVQVLTAPAGRPAGADLVAIVESGHAGVPTVMSAAAAHAAGGLADPRLTISADEWLPVLRQLLDGPAGRAQPAGAMRARATSEALDATSCTDLVVSRLLGWLDHRRRP